MTKGSALFVAIVLPATTLTEVSSAFEPAFGRFKEAAPPRAKLHIADAFAPGNEGWARVAESVREEAYELVRQLRIPVIVEAQRLRDARERRDALDGSADAAIAGTHQGPQGP